MKKSLNIIAAALALLLTFAVFPVSPAKVTAKTAEPHWNVPAGYNEYDYDKCAAFLEITDGDGVKNGSKLSGNYDVNDPETWGTCWGFDEDWNFVEVPCFSWTTSGNELRLSRMNTENRSLFGDLDLSGCEFLAFLQCSVNELTGIDVSDCTALDFLHCYGNDLSELIVSGCTALNDLDCASTTLTELDVSGCTALASLLCQINHLTSLNVSGCTRLYELDCSNNQLTSLDLSDCSNLGILNCFDNDLMSLDISGTPALERLNCSDNCLSELDVSANPELYILVCRNNGLRQLNLSGNDNLPLDTVRAEGNGTFGYSYEGSMLEGSVYANPGEGETFLGWYNAEGEQISAQPVFNIVGTNETELTARFSGNAVIHGSGDIDGSGQTDITDAVLAIRIAMGLIDATPEQVEAGDMNGDYGITVQDAVLILRAAMGL